MIGLSSFQSCQRFLIHLSKISSSQTYPAFFDRKIINLLHFKRNYVSKNDCLGMIKSRNILLCTKQLANTFQKYNIDSAESSAEYIVSHAIGKTNLSGIRQTAYLRPNELKIIHILAQKRLMRVPLQYILGEWDFLDLTLKTKAPVFIPRPETEELVELVKQDACFQSAHNILEVGTGTGAISLSLLQSNPKLQITAIDKSLDACQLIQENAKLNNLEDRIEVINAEFNAHDKLFEHDLVNYDMIVSNPPYILSKDMSLLQPEILWYEDHAALDGGEDGLSVIQAILVQAPKLMRNNGSIWLEVDSSHSAILEEKLNSPTSLYPELEYIRTYEDFNRIQRFCHIKNHSKQSIAWNK